MKKQLAILAVLSVGLLAFSAGNVEASSIDSNVSPSALVVHDVDIQPLEDTFAALFSKGIGLHTEAIGNDAACYIDYTGTVTEAIVYANTTLNYTDSGGTTTTYTSSTHKVDSGTMSLSWINGALWEKLE